MPCDNITPQKEAIEKLVLNRTIEVLGDRKNLALLAEAVMTIQEQRQHDDSVITRLLRERDEIQTALDNVMKAIESGIWTATTKSRLEELELQREKINQKILTEKDKEQTRPTREAIIEYLYHATRKEPDLLLNLLVDKILLFPDRIEIYYKYTQFPPTSPQTDHNITLSVRCSSTVASGSPIGTPIEPVKKALLGPFLSFLGIFISNVRLHTSVSPSPPNIWRSIFTVIVLFDPHCARNSLLRSE